MKTTTALNLGVDDLRIAEEHGITFTESKTKKAGASGSFRSWSANVRVNNEIVGQFSFPLVGGEFRMDVNEDGRTALESLRNALLAQPQSERSEFLLRSFEATCATLAWSVMTSKPQRLSK